VKFFPRQVFKDAVAIFIAFATLFVLAVVAEAPLGRLADPTDTTFVPRPDWYFLFLFEVLRLFEGPLEAFGSYVLPALAMLALILVPFVDRGAMRRVTQRTGAFAAVCLAAVCWGGLTLGAVMSTPAGSAAAGVSTGPADWAQLSPEELAGIGYFRKEQCATCHNLGAGPAKIGPDLGTSQVHKTAAWMIEHFRHPSQMVPGSAMPSIGLDDAQLNSLAAFLLKLTPENAAALAAAPAIAVEGALVYQANHCGSCHMVNGVGMRIGPALNGVGRRHTGDWIVKHFEDPASVSPGTIMPAYRFTPREMDRIVNYLLALP
jgi:ubiquinol-cytochrome c reductase cytochrome b subunit